MLSHELGWTWFATPLLSTLEILTQVVCLVLLAKPLCSSGTAAKMAIIRNSVTAALVLSTSLLIQVLLSMSSRVTLSANEGLVCDYAMLDSVLNYVMVMATASRPVREAFSFGRCKEKDGEDDSEEWERDIDEDDFDEYQENADRKQFEPEGMEMDEISPTLKLSPKYSVQSLRSDGSSASLRLQNSSASLLLQNSSAIRIRRSPKKNIVDP
mmetsp:Transcript_3547/g.6786  ORF Transcript_3547/g.6786 Transcript_3547/m.6786 type:complete len:212 (+) Transcript_3547:615-1250(+)